MNLDQPGFDLLGQHFIVVYLFPLLSLQIIVVDNVTASSSVSLLLHIFFAPRNVLTKFVSIVSK